MTKDADDLLRRLDPQDEDMDGTDLVEPLDGMQPEDVERLKGLIEDRTAAVRRQKILANASSERGIDEQCPLEELLNGESPPGEPGGPPPRP